MKTIAINNAFRVLSEGRSFTRVEVHGQPFKFQRNAVFIKDDTLYVTEVAERLIGLKAALAMSLIAAKEVLEPKIVLPAMVTTRIKPKPIKQIEGEAKFICSSAMLYKAVRIVSQIVKKTHLPILDKVLLVLEKNILTVSATNLEKSLTETIEVESN